MANRQIFEAVLNSEGNFLPGYHLCNDYPGAMWPPALTVNCMVKFAVLLAKSPFYIFHIETLSCSTG